MCLKVLMDLKEHRLLTCPSCGYTRPEQEFRGPYCKLCEQARKDELTG